MSENRLWTPEEDAAEQAARKKKFKDLSSSRKTLYILLLLFIVSWCLLLGHRASDFVYAKYLDEADVYVKGVDYHSAENYVPAELNGIKTVLLVGCDTREGDVVARSDTLMVAFFNIDTGTVNLLSIPRDSYVQIPGYGQTKINHAFAYGGISLTKATVEYLLGITIDDYVIIDFNGFRDVVDAIGGVEIDVDMDMYNYGENIDIKQGLQTLNGTQALGYVRYRGSDCSDYQRIQHQQNFLQALIDKLLSFSSLTKMASLINIGMSNVSTSLNVLTAKDYAAYALQMDLQNMKVHTIQGHSMYMLTGDVWISYELIDSASLNSILAEIAGDGFTFSPNVITDNGQGRYSLPSNEDSPSDDLYSEDGVGGMVSDDSALDGWDGTIDTGNGTDGDNSGTGE